MTLTEAIEKFKYEHHIPYKTSMIENYVNKQAKEYLGGKNGAIDDAVVYDWIRNYNPNQEELEKAAKEKEKAERLLAKQKEEEKRLSEERRKEEIQRTGMEPLF